MVRKSRIFKELSNIKARAEQEILKNQELMKLLSCACDNPLAEPNIKKPSSLVDKYIFFRSKSLNTIQETQSFLLTDYRVVSINGSSDYANIELTFRIIVHNSLFELHDSNIRMFEIADRLDLMFNGEEGSWIGTCRLKDSYPITVPSDYQGIQVTFRMSDFK